MERMRNLLQAIVKKQFGTRFLTVQVIYFLYANPIFMDKFAVGEK
jgi:hypothetical protein